MSRDAPVSSGIADEPMAHVRQAYRSGEQIPLPRIFVVYTQKS